MSVPNPSETISLAAVKPEGQAASGVRGSRRNPAWPIAVSGLLFSLGGCNFGRVIYVHPYGGNNEVCDGVSGICGVKINEPATIVVSGSDVCSAVRLHFGDGQVEDGSNIDFGQTGAAKDWLVSHTYQGWPGPKTITAEGVTNCAGSATWLVHVLKPTTDPVVFREDFKVGFAQPASTACFPVPNAPPLRRNTKVSVIAPTSPKIDFGCWFSGCIRDADGEPNSQAPNGFAFPGLRKYSLVLREGTQIVQGGTNMSFITNQAGPLELCINDDNLSDNSGGWEIDISVDESLAP